MIISRPQGTYFTKNCHMQELNSLSLSSSLQTVQSSGLAELSCCNEFLRFMPTFRSFARRMIHWAVEFLLSWFGFIIKLEANNFGSA